jgi:hypothetical protein
MAELSKIKEFSGLVSQAAKLGKKSITLDYSQSIALLHEINSLLADSVTKKVVTTTQPMAKSGLDGGNFKN